MVPCPCLDEEGFVKSNIERNNGKFWRIDTVKKISSLTVGAQKSVNFGLLINLAGKRTICLM